ncbi:DUF2523 family protein [Psychrobacter sp. AOP22-C1-C5]|uniref:DUF2523 family protein n=1 Tax=Psychrobacter sp. AOP22-C1-C5 TaxID=3457716 RepID=UPI004036151C
MFSGFAGLLKSVNKGWLKDVLSGAGLTLATAGASMILFSQMLNIFKNNLGGIPVDILSLAHIAGFDLFFSLIFGAYVTRMTLNSGNLVLRGK